MTPAELKPAASAKGGVSWRCSACGKVAYQTEERAKEAVAKIRQGTGDDLRAYLGECGWWHLSRTNR